MTVHTNTHPQHGFVTTAVHEWPNEYGAALLPIYRSSLYRVENPENAWDNAFLYSRLGSPNLHALEEKLAALEGGTTCAAFASGMAAISAFMLALLQPGDQIICESVVYGGTLGLLESTLLADLGVTVRFIDMTQPDNLQQALQKTIGPKTQLVYLESPTNPTLNILDIESLTAIAHQHGCFVAIDNTFASPALQQPFAYGVDAVIHSLTKYIGGHSSEVGGAVVLKAPGPLRNDKPLCERLVSMRSMLGSTMTPDTAWLMNQGVKTLALRIEKHCQNAMAVAQFLEQHPKVRRVIYPGLVSHPGHQLAKKQMNGRFGGMVTFEIDGGKPAVVKLLRAIQPPFTVAMSLGGVESLIYSAHLLYEEMLSRHGVTDGMIRVSVGIEDVADLTRALDDALRAL